MQFLTSALSTIFGLLLLSAIVWFSGGGEEVNPLKLLLLLLVLAVPSWIIFRLLDWAYRKVHPAVYGSSQYASGTAPRFNLLQAIVSALRSAVLCLAIPAVSLGLLFVFLAPPLLVIVDSDMGPTSQLLWFMVIALFVFSVMGGLVQWRYNRAVLGLMQEKSAKRSNRRTKKKTQTKAQKLQVRILDAVKGVRQSKAGTEKQRLAKRLQRRAWLRDLIGPLAALAAILFIASRFYPDTGHYNAMTGALPVAWGVLLIFVGLGSRLRLADRTPLRQLRLGVGLWIHALLVAISAPLVLLFELAGQKGRPDQQWTVVPKLGRWISNLLRSPRLVWIPAIGLVSMVPVLPLLGDSEKTEQIPVALSEAFVYFIGGMIAFEIFYRLLDRFVQGRKSKSNRLVFLRVFGDQRRGQFLFSHVAPRWKGQGSITCIAAPDVSVHQLEADIGFDIIFGRLRQRFLTRDEAGVIGRHINSDALGSVWEDHCFDDTWMSAVQSMLTQNAIVMMDLRGFGSQRKGCIYELGVLRDSMPMETVVFLVDDTTDLAFLKNTLEQLWKTVAADSPDLFVAGSGTTKQSQITIFRMSDSKKKSAKELAKLLVEACVSNDTYHQVQGRDLLKALIDDLQLMAADASAQIKAVGGGRWPGKKVLEAGWSCDHDLGSTSYLSSWGLITDQQDNALRGVDELVQYIRNEGFKQTAAALNDDPVWEELRIAARKGLKALGKRRSTPKAHGG